MTSKSLFTNFTKNEIKNKFALFICVVLTFVMLYPIYLAFQLQETARKLKIGELQRSDVVQGFIYDIDGSNTMVVVFTVFFATIIGVFTFGYLYSKSQVDLLHSLPISRKKIFLGKYLSGFLVYEIPLLFFTFIGLGMICVAGYGSMPVVKSAFVGIITHTLGYLVCYSTAVLAVVLTGNYLTGICGVGCFQLYGMAVVGIWEMILDSDSLTYDAYHTNAWEKISKVSPAGAYGMLSKWAEFGGDGKFRVSELSFWMLYVLGFMVIMSVLAYVLFLKRPSEGTTKSMAFPVTKPAIKVVIMSVATILGVEMFALITKNSIGWKLVGLVFVALVLHILFQLLLEQDVKAIFKGFISSMITVALAGMVIFCSGIIGTMYDNYSYNPEKIESMSIQISNNMATDCYQFGPYYDMKTKRYLYGDDYGLQFMKITDKKFIKEFMREIRKDLRDVKITDENDRTDTVGVCYYTTSGEKLYRNYQVNWPKSAYYFEKATMQQEYYQGMNQANQLEKTDITGIAYLYDVEDGGYSTKNLELSKEEIEKIFDTYNKEYNSKNIETLSDSSPLAFLAYQGKTSYSSETIATVCIYDNFGETIKLLKEAGAPVEKKQLDTSKVKTVEVSYTVAGEGVVTVEYTDVESIDKILRIADLYPYCQYTNYMNSEENSLYSVWAYEDNKDDGGKMMNFVKKVPEWIIQDIQDNMKNIERYDDDYEEMY